MAKKQTRRSISVSRTTYERLKAFCESNNISMSQLVETRVNDFLGEGSAPVPTTIQQITPRPTTPSVPRPITPHGGPSSPNKSSTSSVGSSSSMDSTRSVTSAPQQVPMTS